jgi:hypothetical protein
MAQIKNLIGTSDKTCKCGTWLKHWENHSKQTTNFCQVFGCVGTKLVGAHVKYADGKDSNTYIYPICERHNKSTETMNVSDSYTLVSANIKNTCEKD